MHDSKPKSPESPLDISLPESLARDEGRRPAESAGAPATIPVRPIPGEVRDVPMNVIETSSKRSAGDAGRGGVQPDPGTMADDSMQAMRDAGVLGADGVALAEAHSPARFQRRAGAFGLSAGVAMDLRLGWDLELEVDQFKAQKRLSVEKPHLLILSPVCLGRHHLEFACSLAGSQVEPRGRVLFEHPWAATSWNRACKKCWRSVACAGSDATNVSSE